jgi:hypothetical protein
VAGGSETEAPAVGRQAVRSVPGFTLLVLLVGAAFDEAGPPPALATVYRCVDAAGKTVLSNKQSGLHNCEILVEGSTPSAPPETGAGSQPPGPAHNQERSFVPAEVPPMPPHQPPDSQQFSGGEGPPPIPQEPSSPSHQPCSPGLNPLNPLSRPPCTRPDQGERRLPEPAPALPE